MRLYENEQIIPYTFRARSLPTRGILTIHFALATVETTGTRFDFSLIDWIATLSFTESE